MRTPVDNLEPGMEIAADVMNVNNMMLISKGTLLIPRHIRLLKTWGVEFVSIVNAAASQAAPVSVVIPEDILKAAEVHVSNRFSRINVMTDTMQSIKALAIQRVAHRLLRQPPSAKPASSP
jgi:hypothetical protein